MNKEDFKKEFVVYGDALKQEVIDIVKRQWVKENALGEDDEAYGEFAKLSSVDDKINFLNKYYNDFSNEFTIDLERDITDIAYFDCVEEKSVVKSVNCISCRGDVLELYWWRGSRSWYNLYLEEKVRVVRELKEMYDLD